jgi:hypothetical protein
MKVQLFFLIDFVAFIVIVRISLLPFFQHWVFGLADMIAVVPALPNSTFTASLQVLVGWFRELVRLRLSECDMSWGLANIFGPNAGLQYFQRRNSAANAQVRFTVLCTVSSTHCHAKNCVSGIDSYCELHVRRIWLIDHNSPNGNPLLLHRIDWPEVDISCNRTD